MKRDEDVHCNLCEISFSDSEFKNHFSAKHFPKTHFTCYECDAVFQFSNGLLDHLIETHSRINQAKDLKNYSPKNLFKDSKDVLRHTKESKHWTRYAFCYAFENPLNKKQLKSQVKDLYLDGSGRIGNLMCKFCDDTNGNFYCYFCGKHFHSFCSLKCHVLSSHLVLPNILKAVTPNCNICSTVLQSEAQLEEHNHEKHKHELRKEKKSPFCQYCGKSLANRSNLKRHILNQHSEQVGATPINNVFTCHHCKSLFSNKSSVKRHIENLHLKEKDTRKSISCFQCEQKFNSIKNLNAHLTIEHHVTIQEEKIQFPNLPEFWNWKQEEEIKTNSRFIQLRGLRRQRRKGEEISTLKFVCNRSGIFHSKSNGKRAYRIKGSSKIGRYCSSYIEIVFKENSLVDGIYCSTHSGHDNDLRYLALTMDEKREIYEKIKNGASFSTILNEIRNSVGKEIKRKHLVTNKDLHNIVTTFKKLSKPEFEAADTNESSSTGIHEISNADKSPHRSDNGFNNDLDICADLWVETCQRMINHSDQSGMSTIHDPCSKEDISVRNCASTTENDFGKEINPVQPNLLKPVPNFSDQFLRGNEFLSSPSLCASAQLLSSETSLWSKQPHYPLYNGQELDPRLHIPDSSSQYANNLPRSAAEEVHRDLRGFCSIPMVENVQMHKDLYSSDPSLTLNNNSGGVSSEEVETSSNFLNSFYSMTSSAIANTEIQYVQDVNSYDQSINSSIPSPENAFDTTFIIAEADDNNYDDLCSSEKPKNENSKKNPCDGAIQNDKVGQSCSEVENGKNNEMSDLRDRVNSVTALFNIVESELDERKKNIIRNYVDNMFRVLQYRYNKCKTKKKQSVKRKKYQSTTQKRRNRRRGNISTPSRIRNLMKQKPPQVNRQKYIHQPGSFTSSNISAKSIGPCQNGLSHTILTDMRSDINIIRLDQY